MITFRFVPKKSEAALQLLKDQLAQREEQIATLEHQQNTHISQQGEFILLADLSPLWLKYLSFFLSSSLCLRPS